MSAILPVDHFRSLHRAPRAKFFADRSLAYEWVILGMTDTGEIFNVPDWPERLCGLLATQQMDKRLRYSDYLRPTHFNGLAAVVTSSRLERDSPASFAAVMQFATDNQLKVRLGRTGNTTGEYPVLQQELCRFIKS